MAHLSPTIVVPGSGFTEADAEAARQTLREGLKATQTARRRSSVGQMEYVEVPDFQTRAVYAKIVLEHAKGKPVATSVHADLTPQRGGQTEEDFIRSIMADPDSAQSLLETAQLVLEQAKKAASIEITSRLALPEGEKQPPDPLSGGLPR